MSRDIYLEPVPTGPFMTPEEEIASLRLYIDDSLQQIVLAINYLNRHKADVGHPYMNM